MIRVVTVDDHELIREGVKKIVRSSGDIQVVGEAGSFHEAMKILESNRPDLVIFDISLPDMDGLVGLDEVRRRFPEVPMLVLSMYAEELYAINALKLGAAGYITKSMAADELIQAIRRIHIGKSYISSRVAELLAKSVCEEENNTTHPKLTAREREVVHRISIGLQPKQIAADMNISISSVNTYRSRVFKKLGIKNNASLIRYAIANGL